MLDVFFLEFANITHSCFQKTLTLDCSTVKRSKFILYTNNKANDVCRSSPFWHYCTDPELVSTEANEAYVHVFSLFFLWLFRTHELC